MPQVTYNNITAGKRLIGPSVQEGEMAIPSLLVRPLTGHRAAIPIFRYPPTIIQPPLLQGRAVIPNVLTPFPGVYDGSPIPTYTIEWLRDGVVFENLNATYTTQESDDGSAIAIRVTATSESGTIITTSNSIRPVLFESVNVVEYEQYIVTGMGQLGAIQTMNFDYMYISGMAQNNALLSVEAEIYVITEEVP